MNVPPEIFKSYDIRGRYPDQINEENIVPIIKAIYAFFLRDHKEERPLRVVLSRDMRLSSPALFDAASKTLIEMGAHVTYIGISSTPTFYFSVFYYDYDAGIQLTASHNPKDDNGIKFVKSTPAGLVKIGKPTGMEDVKQMAIAGVDPGKQEGGSMIEKNSVLADEVVNALAISGDPEINRFKIVADAANALGSIYIDGLAQKVPMDLVRMNWELDGTFPAHPADPLDYNNLKDLQAKVIEEKADIGLAPDGDGDRLFFINERGEIVPPSVITGLVAREMLREHPGETILFDIRYILTPKRIVEENGGKYVITKVGHAFISQEMERVGGIFAGESSSHFFFRETGNAEAQLPMIITVLEVMSREGKPLSVIVEELRRSYESGEINFKVENAQEIIVSLKEKYSEGELSELDGVAITYPNWRFSVRTSNTEPVLRLNVEGETKEIVEEKRQEIVKFLESSGAKSASQH